MLARILATQPSRTLFAQRCALGLIMAAHGAQKTFGLFGGYGFSGTMAYLTSGSLALPAVIAFLVIASESAGALGLVLGAGTRVAAFGIAATMVGAIFTSHLAVGFFMNWSGSASGEGFEYHLLALALAIPLIVRGGGSYALDRVLAAKLDASAPSSVLSSAAAA